MCPYANLEIESQIPILGGFHAVTPRAPLLTAQTWARRSRTAKASRITGGAGKSRRAGEWDGWGRLSSEGPGQNNPDRSEGPWGRAAQAARMAVFHRVTFPTLSGTTGKTTESS